MAQLLRSMPAVSRHNEVFEDEAPDQEAMAAPTAHVPLYLQRKGFVPRTLADFGDGGAFPEIHVSQYPLEMGRPNKKKQVSSAIVAVDVGADGEVKYDAIVKQGGNRDKTVYTSLDDMKAKDADALALALPSEEEADSAVDKTKAALEKIIGAKVAASKPTTGIVATAAASEAKFIKYTPNPQQNSGVKQRIIRMVDAQVDPMEPAKHKHKKVPRGPPSPPVPVLHSPPRKVTVKDQQAWKVPPCISNWKNARGYTIPLDKRLPADGRGLQEQTINNNFATLSEALYIAERKAREEVEFRTNIKQKLAVKEKEQKETELRQLAAKARMQRAGIADDTGAVGGGGGGGDRDGGRYEDRDAGRERSASPDDRRDSRDGGRDDGPDEDEVARQQREKLRLERRKEREREMRHENMKGEFKRSKHEKERERDISEKIALGLHQGAQKPQGDGAFDQRLFNQNAGMDSGFGAEDNYSVYSKPMLDRGEAQSVYRPKRDDSEMYGNADEQYNDLANSSKRFKPDKGFAGADGDGHARDGPVQFDKGDQKLGEE
mmetsp:Transcript_31566/g.83373  ORF Transcript_31566/g.83373 Transcript_31566/m.83373 type:complete len:547 (+) Transcript_31566:113-1753(+)